MTKIHVAAIQCPLGGDIAANNAVIEGHVRDAAAKGAKLILPPELFEGPYFCKVQELDPFATAAPLNEHASVSAMQKLARNCRSISRPASSNATASIITTRWQ